MSCISDILQSSCEFLGTEVNMGVTKGIEPFPGFGLLLSDVIMPPVSVPCTEKVPVVLRGQRMVLPLSVGPWPCLFSSLL